MTRISSFAGSTALCATAFAALRAKTTTYAGGTLLFSDENNLRLLQPSHDGQKGVGGQTHMRMRLFPLIALSLLFSTLSYGQAWSNILSSSRAINWSNAGLPATLPDGETTPNPWTPPTRTQCGSTISPSGNATTDTTNVNNALVACAAGHYVLLAPGSFTFNGNIIFYTQNGITLRGAGAQSTFVTLTSGAWFQFGGAYGSGSCTWSAGYAAGSTSITLTSCSQAPQTGEVIFLSQCNTGLSGSGCTSGSQADNGGIFVCAGVDNVCQRPGEGSQPPNVQQQAIYVTSVVNNSGTYTVNFTPGLYMGNWNATGNNGTAANWTTGAHTVPANGNGLEDVTLYNNSDGANQSVELRGSYASWVKGVRFIGSGSIAPLLMLSDKNCLVANNYIFADPQLDGNYPPAMQEGNDSDDLIINNVMTFRHSLGRNGPARRKRSCLQLHARYVHGLRSRYF